MSRQHSPALGVSRGRELQRRDLLAAREVVEVELLLAQLEPGELVVQLPHNQDQVLLELLQAPRALLHHEPHVDRNDARCRARSFLRHRDAFRARAGRHCSCFLFSRFFTADVCFPRVTPPCRFAFHGTS